MPPLNITLVAGPPGAGKTTWIWQQVHTATETAIYLSLEDLVDTTFLAAEVPGLTVSPVSQLTDLLAHPLARLSEKSAGCRVYLELGFQIDLTSLIFLNKMADCHRVALLPPGTRQTEWHSWADLVVMGAKTNITLEHLHLWRSALTGQDRKSVV